MSIIEYSAGMEQTLRKAKLAWVCSELQKRRGRVQMRRAALRWREAQRQGEAELAKNCLDIAIAYREFLRTLVVPQILGVQQEAQV